MSTPQYKLGLALSGGSIKGFVHLGVLKYMEEHGLRPDILAGTSAGSIMAAFYASGYSPDEICQLFTQGGFLQMTSLAVAGGGLFSTTNFYKHLSRHLPYKRIEDLPIPLRIVATDLDLGEQHVFSTGSIAKAVLASCSIPILFQPVEIGGHTYVDGGLFRNFPATIIRDDCETLIGVNLGPVQVGKTEKSLRAIANRSWELVFRQNTAPDRDACDYLLETAEAGRYGMFDISAATDLMSLGYQLAEEQLSVLVSIRKS